MTNQRSFWQDLANSYANNKELIAFYSWLTALGVMALAILLSSLSFMTVALNNIWDCYEIARESEEEKAKENITGTGHKGALA